MTPISSLLAEIRSVLVDDLDVAFERVASILEARHDRDVLADFPRFMACLEAEAPKLKPDEKMVFGKVQKVDPKKLAAKHAVRYAAVAKERERRHTDRHGSGGDDGGEDSNEKGASQQKVNTSQDRADFAREKAAGNPRTQGKGHGRYPKWEDLNRLTRKLRSAMEEAELASAYEELFRMLDRDGFELDEGIELADIEAFIDAQSDDLDEGIGQKMKAGYKMVFGKIQKLGKEAAAIARTGVHPHHGVGAGFAIGTGVGVALGNRLGPAGQQIGAMAGGMAGVAAHHLVNKVISRKMDKDHAKKAAKRAAGF